VRIFSRSTLVEFWKKHPDAEGPLRAWFHEVNRAAWKGPADVRARYGSADFVGRCVVFNIGGNKYRLVTLVRYGPFYAVYIRFVGTHAEYNALDVKEM
jgi:mRNA interferase HigB